MAERTSGLYNYSPATKHTFVNAMFTRTPLRQNNQLNLTANYLANFGNATRAAG
jgi:predicted ABC-type exoprotein transport system permease subunit